MTDTPYPDMTTDAVPKMALHKPEYRIISERSEMHLEKAVTAFLAEGWSLVGGVSVILDRCDPLIINWHFSQAMTR